MNRFVSGSLYVTNFSFLFLNDLYLYLLGRFELRAPKHRFELRPTEGAIFADDKLKGKPRKFRRHLNGKNRPR